MIDPFSWYKAIRSPLYGYFLIEKIDGSEILISFRYNGMRAEQGIEGFQSDESRDEYFEIIDVDYCEALYETKTPSLN